MSEISRDVIFSEKKAPAGMPTHRTGVGVGGYRGGNNIYIYIYTPVSVQVYMSPTVAQGATKRHRRSKTFK